MLALATQNVPSAAMSETTGSRGTPAHLPVSILSGKHAQVVDDFVPTPCGSIHGAIR
jgi:hypothetical protein